MLKACNFVGRIKRGTYFALFVIVILYMEFSWSLLILPFIAATIGWFTNFIAVKMLFHPRKPISFLGIKIHGIFPKRQGEIAVSVGKMVANDLLNIEELQKRLATKESATAIVDRIESALNHYFEIKFPEKFPFLSKVVSSKMRGKIKDEILEEVEALAPNLIANQVNKLEEVFDVEKIVSEKVTNLSSDKLESLMLGIIAKELKFIEWVGALLGFFIGLVQVGLLVFF